LGGQATLSIEYRNYKIIKASPLNAATGVLQTASAVVGR
jgi:hypothetical protein